jgi:phage shock protein PspC (stress-responsive transcriptional regulator)
MQNVQTASEQATDESFSADSLFGVCEAIGRDFGFNAFFLRLAFLALGFFSIPASVAAYALLGAAVAVSRWLFPANPDSDSDETCEPHLHEAANRVAAVDLLAA